MMLDAGMRVKDVQLAFAALLAVAWPLYDHYIDWPRFQRELRENPRYARLREYRWAILVQWVFAAGGALLWLAGAGATAGLGLQAPTGWRLWASAAFLAPFVGAHGINLVKVIRSERTRAYLRERMKYVEGILPVTAMELGSFLALSVTAGVCEEFLFRGYLLWVLAPVMTWWGAALCSVASFGVLHAYQGRKGVIQASLLGALMTALVMMARSLVPAMILHALIDIGSGLMTWFARRELLPPGSEEQAAVAAR
jgi:CAAX protease family protein